MEDRRALRPHEERLSPLDASFLYLERPTELLHVGAVSVLDGPVQLGALRAMLGARLGELRRYRQRPVRPLFDLTAPAWKEDPKFDPAVHIHQVSAPAPGGEAELHELVDALFARPMDDRHPLWEAFLIDGLSGDRSAVLTKVHHCMIDGVSGAQILEVMTDGSATPGDTGPGATPRTASSAGGRRSLMRIGRDAVMGAFATVTSPRATLNRMREVAGAAGVIAEVVRERVEPMPFNGVLTGARRIVWSSFPLDDFLAMRGTVGCKVNDVVLAVIAGALRRYLPASHVAGYGSRLRALIPVNVRRADEHLTLGNRVSAMFAHLPIGVADPIDRLRCVADEMRATKERGQRQALDLALALSSSLPSAVGSALTRFMTRAPVHTICTNVPGSPATRYILGRRIIDMHPIVPIAAEIGLAFAIMSYDGKVSICATADAKLVPDAERIGEALTASHMELRAHLGVGKPHTTASNGGPTIADLMSRDVVTVSAGESAGRAWELMRTRRIRHLPVVDARGRVIGLVSHRDLLAASQSSLSFGSEGERVRMLGWAHVADLMETHLSTVNPDESAADAGRRMVRHKIGCLPAVDAEGGLVGIVTEEDFLRWATAHMEPG